MADTFISYSRRSVTCKRSKTGSAPLQRRSDAYKELTVKLRNKKPTEWANAANCVDEEVLFYLIELNTTALQHTTSISAGLHNSLSLPSAARTAKFSASFIHVPFSAAVL